MAGTTAIITADGTDIGATDNTGTDHGCSTGAHIMRHTFIGLSMLLASLTAATPAMGQVHIGISIPGVSLGIYQSAYPELVLVPGYPVYYAPDLRENYFFYDGQYWVYQDDHWYVSSWYNGPWDYVTPESVPLFVLRIPVQYYRAPPAYFYGWYAEAPPRWDLHWGHRWAQHRHGWDHWDRRQVYMPAPLPHYQRQYAGNRYPRAEHQRELHGRHYHHQSYHPTTRAAVSPHRQQQRAMPQTQPRTSSPQVARAAPRAQRAPRDQDLRRQGLAAAQAAPRTSIPAVREQRQPQLTERRVQQAPRQPAPTREPQVRSHPREQRTDQSRRPGRQRAQTAGGDRGQGRQQSSRSERLSARHNQNIN